MPNVLDTGPVRAFAQRAGLKIKNDAVRTRFERLAFERLMQDQRNFRPVTAQELAAAPDWARETAARGEDLVSFKLNRSASSRLHNVARWLAATCELAAANSGRQSDFAHAISEARSFVAKIERAALDVIADKAQRFARAFVELDVDEDFEIVCETRAVAATGGRIWRRVTYVAALRSVGREFHNCLARPPHAHHHAAGLRCGLRQYWVLRDRFGHGLVVAMADAPHATHFIEVRGPRNAFPRGHELDLKRLGAAIGMAPPPPPPPLSDALSALAIGCRCARCLIRNAATLLPAAATAP